MSVLNQSGEEQVECPLCMEPLEVDDLHFYPCTCGYQICRFCWNRIRETENGLCPACRKAYPENPADFTPLSQEQVAAIKTEKKAREQKKRNKTLESRRALANVRVVQNNLVFVVGLPVRLADPEILKRQEYFGKYGKIHKVVINQSTTYAGSQGPSASAYVTYVSGSDALRAIQGVNNVTLDGRVLKGSLGTTKYCANFMKNQPCPKPDCMYLHELGDPKASFTKEEMHQGLHQVYERKLHNQLIASQRDKPTDSIINATGNPSTNGEKSSTKDGNNSNFITTTVVTSANINIVNSSKSKKDCMNGNGGSSSSGSSTSGKEAWPSLTNAQSDNIHTVKSQENGTPESSSPTPQTQQQTAQTKNSKENYTETSKSRNKDGSTNGQSKKNKSDSKKHKNSHSINSNSDETETGIESKALNSNNTHAGSVFENDKVNSYLSNELDELESDRHSLLENYDLLDNSDHSLLEDDTHNLLDDAASEPIIMQNNREMLSGLVDNNHLLPHLKSPLVNGFGLLDRDVLSYLGNDRPVSQINQGHIDQKELLLRERSRSEMLMRQNELLARQHNIMVEPKRFMPSSSIGLESASELLGANFHQNPNMLPPFGMRMENSIAANSMGANSLSASSLSANALGGNTMSVNSLGGNNMSVNTMGGNTISMNSLGGNSISVNAMGGNGMSVNSMGGNNLGGNTMSVNSLGGNTMSVNVMGNSHAMGVNSHTMGGNSHAMSGNSHAMGNNLAGNSLGGSTMGGFMLHNQQLLQNQQHMQQSGLVNGLDNQSNEGRYLAENMDKFFTDFHKAQQMKLVLIGQNEDRRYQQHAPHNMLTVNSLEMDHKQRLNNMRGSEVGGGRAAGDGDDDLDFDPFKETQKALAEMMETEMMQNSVSSGDNMDRVRRSRLAPPGFGHVNAFNQPRPHHMHPGFNTNSAMFSDWTQMDPAIMSTSVNANKPAPTSTAHHDVLARFNQLQLQASWGHKPWTYPNIPLPPGFAPPKTSQHPPECIDAK